MLTSVSATQLRHLRIILESNICCVVGCCVVVFVLVVGSCDSLVFYSEVVEVWTEAEVVSVIGKKVRWNSW